VKLCWNKLINFEDTNLKNKILLNIIYIYIYIYLQKLCFNKDIRAIPSIPSSKAHFTLGVRADVQPKSNIPIGAKVEIGPKGFPIGCSSIY